MAATIKVKDIHAMSNDDILSKLGELKKELVKERAQLATGTAPKDPHKIRQLRKTIARMLTELRARELKDKK